MNDPLERTLISIARIDVLMALLGYIASTLIRAVIAQ